MTYYLYHLKNKINIFLLIINSAPLSVMLRVFGGQAGLSANYERVPSDIGAIVFIKVSQHSFKNKVNTIPSIVKADPLSVLLRAFGVQAARAANYERSPAGTEEMFLVLPGALACSIQNGFNNLINARAHRLISPSFSFRRLPVLEVNYFQSVCNRACVVDPFRSGSVSLHLDCGKVFCCR